MPEKDEGPLSAIELLGILLGLACWTAASLIPISYGWLAVHGPYGWGDVPGEAYFFSGLLLVIVLFVVGLFLVGVRPPKC